MKTIHQMRLMLITEKNWIILKTGVLTPVFFVFCNENNQLVNEVLHQHF